MSLNTLDLNAELNTDFVSGKFDRDLAVNSGNKKIYPRTSSQNVITNRKFTSKFETNNFKAAEEKRIWIASSPERLANLYQKASGNLNQLLQRPMTSTA